MARSIFGGKNTSTEIATGVDASTGATNVSKLLTRYTTLELSGSLSTSLPTGLTSGVVGSGAVAIITDNTMGGIRMHTGATNSSRAFFYNTGAAGLNPLISGFKNTTATVSLEFDIELINWLNGAVGTFAGFWDNGTASGTLLGTAANVIGVRWKDATTAEFVCDKAGTEGKTDLTFSITDGDAHHVKIVITSTSASCTVDDVAAITNSTATQLPIVPLGIGFNTSNAAAGGVIQVLKITNIRWYTDP